MINKKEPINIASLLISLVALVIGVIFCFNDGEAIFKVIGFVVSGILILSGAIKAIAYFLGRKKGSTTFGDLVGGLIFIVSGILIAMFPNFIPTTISIVLGILILFNGIQRLILGLAVRQIDAQGAKVFLIEAIVMILLGIIVMTKLLLNFIGFFMIAYAISGIIGYVYYTSQNKDYSEVLNKTVPKDIKKKEAKEGEFEEE